MKQIDCSQITKTVKQLCIEANIYLPNDIKSLLEQSIKTETWEPARQLLQNLVKNYNLAEQELLPICQDTGVACVFIEIGQEVSVVGGSINDAINEGVRQGYAEGFFRKSVVNDPLNRINTTTNTPAMIYYEIVPGDELKICVSPKGFGSENMSRIKMFNPTDGLQSIIDFIVESVKETAVNACPPLIVGIGIGGTFDKAALIAKKALLRSVKIENQSPYYAKLEEEILFQINELGIGPSGTGGRTTALKVNIETLPTHIAGLPCAINMGCHATRHKEAVL